PGLQWAVFNQTPPCGGPVIYRKTACQHDMSRRGGAAHCPKQFFRADHGAYKLCFRRTSDSRCEMHQHVNAIKEAFQIRGGAQVCPHDLDAAKPICGRRWGGRTDKRAHRMATLEQRRYHARPEEASSPGNKGLQMRFPSFFSSSTSRFTSTMSSTGIGEGRPLARDSY